MRLAVSYRKSKWLPLIGKMGSWKSRFFRSKSLSSVDKRRPKRVPLRSFRSIDSSLTNETECDVQYTIQCLLENLNRFGDMVNRFSAEKSVLEMQLEFIDLSFHKLIDNIRVCKGKTNIGSII